MATKDAKGQKRERELDEQPQKEKEKNVNGADKSEQEPDPKRQLTEHQPHGVLEEGRIYFFYRPRVGLEEAHSLSDVQRFFIILSPTSRKDAPHRLLAIGKKRLPDPAKHERFFGFVQATDKQVENSCADMGIFSKHMDGLMAGMGPKESQTKTRGVRRTEAARAVGEGVYSIVEHGNDTRLVYKLELPETPGDVQDEFKITNVGNYHISIKNPDIASPPNGGLSGDRKADYPEEKKKEFEGTPGGYSWISAKDPSLLDYNGCEVLLIGAKAEAQGELDGKLEKHLEEAKEADIKDAHQFKGGDEDSQLVAKLKEEIAADKHDVSIEPAADGEFK